MTCDASTSIPCIMQGDRRASMEMLSGISGFAFLKLFRDGSGTLYDTRGREIAGFFDVNDLQRISETRMEALNRYESKVERRRVVGYTSDDPADRKGVRSFESRWRFWGPALVRKPRDRHCPVVSHGEALADLKMLAYFDAFTSVNLNRDGSGSVRDFNEEVVERFGDVEGLNAILSTQAVKERLQGAGKVF